VYISHVIYVVLLIVHCGKNYIEAGHGSKIPVIPVLRRMRQEGHEFEAT
jgi:hypothetical protein